MVGETTISELASFTHARLRSERIRAACMAAVAGVALFIGVFRTFKPIQGGALVGPIILVMTAAFLLLEALMLRGVQRGVRTGRDLPPAAWRATTIAECLFPVLIVGVIMIASRYDPHTLLVSPVLPFILVVMTVSILHLDPTLTILGGLTATLAYLGLVIGVVATDRGESPHPRAMYFMLALMPAIGTGVTTFVTARVRSYVNHAIREMEVRRDMDRIAHDLEIARDIQRGLLPTHMPDVAGFDIAAMSRPADRTGGDYYDWQPLGDGRVVISLADVTGHGVGPALVTAACRAYVRATVDGSRSVQHVVARVNQLLSDDLDDGRFVTFVMLEIDERSRRAVFLSAGHGPSLYLRGDSDEITSVLSQGVPLGLMPDPPMDDPVALEFGPGDVVAMFSDGFFEWANAQGELFGVERLRQVIHENRDEAAATIIQRMDEAARAFVGNRAQDDDMTAVVVRYVG